MVTFSQGHRDGQPLVAKTLAKPSLISPSCGTRRGASRYHGQPLKFDADQVTQARALLGLLPAVVSLFSLDINTMRDA